MIRPHKLSCVGVGVLLPALRCPPTFSRVRRPLLRLFLPIMAVGPSVSAFAETESDVGGSASLAAFVLGVVGCTLAVACGYFLLRKARRLRAAEQAVRQLEQTLDRVSDVIFRYRPHEGRFDYVSSSVERITGFGSEEFLALGPRDVLLRVFPEDQLHVFSGLGRVLGEEARDGEAAEYRWRVKDGSYIWARTAMRVVRRDDGEVDAIVTTTQISTLQKRVEAHARARTQRIISNFPGAVFRLVRNPDGSYFVPYITDGGLRLFGTPAESLINNMGLLEELCPRADRIRLAKALRRSAETMTDLEEEIQVTPKDKPALWALVRSVPRTKSDGRILWDGVMLDVTELKRAEEETTALQRQLYQSQKLEAIGRLAGGVAHDFNNLLTAILGYSSFLLESLDENSEQREDVEQIQKAGEKASALTQQLLAFSRRQVVKPVPVDVNEAVSGLSKMLRRVIGEDIDLQLHLAGSPCWVKADPALIDQILMNLAVNARDAMPQGGRLTVETGTVTLDGPAAWGDFEIPPGRYVMFSVSDTGCGMDEGTQRRVFDPFFTTKELGKGTGLGMATVYGAVKQSGGYIGLASEVQKGTTVKTYLPFAPKQSGAQSDEPAPAPEQIHSGAETILLVEDDDAVRLLAKRFLTENGYTVYDAESGEKALDVCGRQDIGIDLLLTDTIMPGMNGPQLAEKAKQLRPTMKTVFMSGYTDTVLAQSGLLNEDTILIAKPFSAVSLTRDIRRALAGQPAPVVNGAAE